MNKAEFLHALQGRLAEELPRESVEEHVRYYDAYIAERVGQGQDEREVIGQLGDPLLIAKTIMDTSGVEAAGNGRRIIYGDQEETQESGYGANWERENPRVRHFQIQTRMGCLLAAIIFVVAIALILWLVGSVVSFLLPVLIPVIVVLLVVGYLKEKTR